MVNKVFLAGYVVNDVKYEFIIHGKDNSIAKFSIQTNKEKIIEVTTFNETADYSYRRLKIGDYVVMCGRFSQKYGVVINEIQKMSKYNKND